MKIEVTRETLERLSLFTGLSADALTELSAQCRMVSVSKGETIFRQGDRSTTIYVIETGCIEIKRTYEDGETLVLSVFGDGEMIGELSAISSEPRAASGIAREDTQLIALDNEVFFAYLGRYPSMAVEVMVRLTRRLREMNIRVRELGVNNAASRVASLLLFLAEEHNQIRTGLISSRFSLERIARAASVEMSYARDLLEAWEEEGHIGLDGRRFLLHDTDALIEIAGW